MRRINRYRLLKLAAHLDNVPESSFDLEHWVSKCETAACAVGHATGIPEFRAAGLTLDIDESGCWHPRYRRWSGWPAVAHFFGLSIDQAKGLLSAEAYEPDENVLVEGDAETVPPSRVAKRIRQFVWGIRYEEVKDRSPF